MTPSLDSIPTRAMLVGLTLVNVCMQLGSAFLLKIAPEPDRKNLLVVGFILGAVFALNVVRFVVWGRLHERFPISVAYPASALFFPGVVTMAWLFGERVGVLQVIGSCCVLAGVALLLSNGRDQP